MAKEVNIKSGWLDTNERLEVVNSLEKTRQFILEVRDDLYQWKWVIIALHNSVQASMVLALRGSAPFNVYGGKNKEKWIRAFNSQLENPQQEFPKEQFLARFCDLYERIKSEDMKMYINSKCFMSTEGADDAMKNINIYRNKFIHFAPDSWSLQVLGLPGICKEMRIPIYHCPFFNYLRSISYFSSFSALNRFSFLFLVFRR